MAPLAALGRRRRIEAAGELRRKGDTASAVDVLAGVLASAPEDPAANVEMARSLQLLEDFAGAEEHYRRALIAHLDYALVIELAGVIGAQDRTGEADELLDAALQIAETDRSLDPGEVHFARAINAVRSGDADVARESLARITESSSKKLREFAQRLAATLEPQS